MQNLNQIKTNVAHIIGNVKGGVKSPVDAIEEIHQLYASALQAMRYPGEPKLLNTKPTQEQLEMEYYFTQADKGK